jgi:serine/threonine protein kinase
MHVHLDNDTKLAYMKITSSEREVVAIKRFENADDEIIQDLVNTPHPNIVKSFGMMAFSSHILVVHECMDTTLAQVISAPMRLDEEQIATVCSEVNLSPTHSRTIRLNFSQVLKGVSFLRGKNLVHGSLKSQNILLSLNGVVKIGNFSTCRRKQGDDNNGPSLGILCMEMMEPDSAMLAEALQRAPRLESPEL